MAFIMNEMLEHCRKLALNVLKPSKKDLEHGLELHRDSLVWDAYGFAPSGWVRDSVQQVIQDGATNDEANDEFEYGYLYRVLNNPQLWQEAMECWETAGVDCIFQNSGVESNSVGDLIKRLSYFTAMVDHHSNDLMRAVFPQKVIEAKKQQKHSLYFTTNGVPLTDNLFSAEEALRYIRIFANFGVRMMHMTYNRRNLLGDGCAERADAGLSDLGRKAVAEMNRYGIIPDVAHSGQQTSFETAQCSKLPVVASHTVVGGLSSHYRAKRDDVMKAIAASGGFVGICCHPPFLRGSGMIDSFLDHIDYAVSLLGADHVAIGTDHYNPVHPDGKMPDFVKSRRIFESFWPEPEDNFEMTDEMYDCVAWTNWPLFTVGLVQKGYSDDDIRKIIGLNVLKVTETSWQEREKLYDEE